MKRNGRMRLWSPAAILCLVACGANAADVSVRALAANPARYNGQTVTLHGTVAGLKEFALPGGDGYTTFNLKAPRDGGTIGIVAWGQPALRNGDPAEIVGTFEHVQRIGSYTLYNDVEAQIVEPAR